MPHAYAIKAHNVIVGNVIALVIHITKQWASVSIVPCSNLQKSWIVFPCEGDKEDITFVLLAASHQERSKDLFCCPKLEPVEKETAKKRKREVYHCGDNISQNFLYKQLKKMDPDIEDIPNTLHS